MNWEPQIIVVGSGPAGVSVAYPLVQAGLNVLMLDADNPQTQQADTPKITLQTQQEISPKLSTPAFQERLRNWHAQNRLKADDFTPVSILQTGGLSRYWGAGISVYEEVELSDWPISTTELMLSYEAVLRRIGASGARENFPSQLVPLLQESMALDRNHSYLLAHFRKKARGFKLWPAHNAVLTENRAGRLACDLNGNCLNGCKRQAIWNAGMEVDALLQYPNFRLEHGFVQKIEKKHNGWHCLVDDNGCTAVHEASHVVLAAGTLGTTRLVLTSFRHTRPVAFYSNPSAGFMLSIPRHMMCRHHESFYGMAQLNFSMQSDLHGLMFGNLFNARAVPLEAYLQRSSLPSGLLRTVLPRMLSFSVIGNCFFSGKLSAHQFCWQESGESRVTGGYSVAPSEWFGAAGKKLAAHFRSIGAMLLPWSFRLGTTGADVHYAGSFPMRAHPQTMETDRFGQLVPHEGIFIADGANFSSLPAQPLTLTIMANAHRIGTLLAQRMK